MHTPRKPKSIPDFCIISHPIDPKIYELSGPAAIRAMFFPRQRVSLKEAAGILGLGYHRLWKLHKEGSLSLPVRLDDSGRSFVLIEDLITYVFSSHELDNGISRYHIKNKKRPGRPRKSTEGGAR